MNRNYLPTYWDDFFNDKFYSNNHLAGRNGTSPAVNVVEGEKEYRIEVAVPGLSKKDFRIDLDDNVLTISSEQKENKEEKKSNYMRREFNYNSFKRSFQLPDTVDFDHISANSEAGVLTIQLPKKEEVVQKAPKQIEVK